MWEKGSAQWAANYWKYNTFLGSDLNEGISFLKKVWVNDMGKLACRYVWLKANVSNKNVSNEEIVVLFNALPQVLSKHCFCFMCRIGIWCRNSGVASRTTPSLVQKMVLLNEMQKVCWLLFSYSVARPKFAETGFCVVICPGCLSIFVQHIGFLNQYTMQSVVQRAVAD